MWCHSEDGDIHLYKKCRVYGVLRVNNWWNIGFFLSLQRVQIISYNLLLKNKNYDEKTAAFIVVRVKCIRCQCTGVL
jgi:hypothetical protein